MEKRKICADKLAALLKAMENGTEQEFLLKANAKQMQGAQYVRKFRVTDGDRILFVYAGDVPQFGSSIPSDALILLRYVNHDAQGKVAAGMDFTALDADGLCKYQTDFRFTEQTTLLEAQDYFGKMQTHRIAGSQLSQYLQNAEQNYDVMLSPEQAEILRHAQYPLVLYGCAGSGKTILSTHILYQHMQLYPEGRGLYTTMSRNLCQQVKMLYQNIDLAETGEGTDTQQAEFLTVSELMMRDLKIPKNRFVGYEKFQYQFCQQPGEISWHLRQLEKLAQIGILDIWAEIRGILKGHLDEYWYWNQPFRAADYGDFVIRWLCAQGFIMPTDQSYKEYCVPEEYGYSGLFYSVRDRIRGDETLTDSKKASLQHEAGMIDIWLSEFDAQKKVISRQEYLALSSEYSVYPHEIRDKIYDFYLLYARWMEENNLLDDNDLARAYCASPKKTAYDFITVDEVQDLTEMQIFALSKACTHPSNMVYAGDIHQVVNPTYYSEERIRKLYYSRYGGQSVAISHLKKNYRSQDKVVKLANELSDIRKRRIGSRSQASEVPEESTIEGWSPMQLCTGEENLEAMVNTVNELPNGAIIAMDSNSAGDLTRLLRGTDNGNIYTVPEIKGLEKKYVFCYDLASDCYKAWQDIFSDTDIRKNVKYRYYFNTLYVAVTRAQTILCFYEKHIPPAMQQWLDQFVDWVPEFDANKMFLADDGNAGENWYRSALECEENGDYRRAVAQYKKSEFRDYLYCMARCHVKQLLAEGREKETVQYGFHQDAPELFRIISEFAQDQQTASLADRIYRYMTEEESDISPSELLAALRPYEVEGKFVHSLLEQMETVTELKIWDLIDEIHDQTEKMRRDK